MAQTTIGIDCRLGGVRHGGIGRYIAEYVRRVVATTAFSYSLVFYDEQQRTELLEPLSATTTARLRTTIVPIRHYSLDEQLKLPTVLNRLELDVLHVPHFNVPIGYRRPFVVTIHDLLWHAKRGTTVTTLPRWQYWPKYGAYRIASADAIRRAKRIFVPTEFVASTISQQFPSAKSKTVVTYEGVATNFKPDSKQRRRSKQLLYVGSLYPHKNVGVVLDALQQLPEHQLVIVGARDVFSQTFQNLVKEKGLTDRVIFKGKVSDAELVELYQTTSCVTQPSTSEGFGLTGVEALSCGTPLLASDIPVFHEVYGQAAIFFDPSDAADLVKAIQMIDNAEYVFPTKTVEQTLKRYSWDTMTQTMLSEIKEVLAQKNQS
jgi:glycosyltransferase involved in cell wall biosynthesis